MKNREKLYISIFVTLLGSCAGEGKSLGSNVYTVRFLDDTNNEIGYSYVIEGKSAIFQNKDKANPYDYLPKDKKRDEGTNSSYYVFDCWKRCDDKGEFILDEDNQRENNIQSDCYLKATFKRSYYRFKTRFLMDQNTLGYQSATDTNPTTKEDKTDIPVDKTLFEIKGDESLKLFPFKEGSEPIRDKNRYFYYQENIFNGWKIKISSSEAMPFSSEELDQLKFESYEWKFGDNPDVSVVGEASTKKGTFLLNTALNEKNQPTYPFYLSDGKEWLSLGNLSQTPLISFVADFSNPLRTFPLYVLQDEPSSYPLDSSLIPLGNLPYGSKIEIHEQEIWYGDAKETLDGTKKFLIPSTITSSTGHWAGTCFNFGKYPGTNLPQLNNHNTLDLDFSSIACDAVIYPAKIVK